MSENFWMGEPSKNVSQLNVLNLQYLNPVCIKQTSINHTCGQEFEPWVSQIHRDEIFEPNDGGIRITKGRAQHDSVPVLLHGFKGRTLIDAWITTWYCK